MKWNKPVQDERVAQLIEEFNFHPCTAKIYVEYNGKCAYCGLDLLETAVKYSSVALNRILPQAKYPELEWEESNLALSCSSCSSIKGDYDVLDSTKKNIPEILQNYKDILINKIMTELSNRMQTIENERIRVKQIIRGFCKAG